MTSIRDASGARASTGDGREGRPRSDRAWLVAMLLGIAFVAEARLGDHSSWDPAQIFGGIFLMAVAFQIRYLSQVHVEMISLHERLAMVEAQGRELEERADRRDETDMRMALALRCVTTPGTNRVA